MSKTQAKILIVEDESIVAQDLQAILEDLGYYVPVFVDSGELAIEKATEIQPNLILMDIRLIGEMDGIEAAHQITEKFDIPIIYLTAHGDEDTLARAKITQPFGYIIKPFKEQELQIAIEIALYKHQIDYKLKENSQWLATILNSISDGVIVTNGEGNITFINPSAEKITGWALAEAVNKPLTSVFNIIDENTQKSLNDFIIQVIKSGDFTTLPESAALITKNGSEVSISDSIAPMMCHYQSFKFLPNFKEQITGSVLVFRDDTERRLAQQQLRHQAFNDPLTNLPNRSWFRERLTDAIERVKRNHEYLFAVLFLDLDRFKTINDSLGHWTGDQLLISVANRLLRLVRPIDTVARLGGDEFAILLENIAHINEACKVAQRIQQDLSTSFKIRENKVFTNASIGIVFSSIGYHSVEDVIKDADIAMYRAKEKGKGRYEIFEHSMRQAVIDSLTLENELWNALKKKELKLYFQPIISLKNQQTVGFEALVRWQHPEKGLLTAGDFITIAEESELILKIDHWVLKNACKQLKLWQEKYPESAHWTMSINLSSRQFLKPHLDEEIVEILREIGLPPSCLKIEITEGILIKNPEATMIILSKLKSLGISLSLDDFGTGYSSLNYLYRFPVNTLKIDRSFVERIEQDKNGLEIVRSIILLAHNLGLDVIAEGIETSQQLTLLQELDCEYGQGYLLGKPLAADLFFSNKENE